MRTETTTRNLYTFDELSETAKENAINQLSGINVNYDWWESVFEDADQVGITITSFDLDRNRHAESKIDDPEETAKSIVIKHGDTCETFKTAKSFLDEYSPLNVKREKCLDIMNRHDVSNWYDKLDNLQQELNDQLQDLQDGFKKSIAEDYSTILQHEYEYLTCKESVIETITCNNYEFTEDGKLL